MAIYQLTANIDAPTEEHAKKVLSTLMEIRKHLTDKEIFNMPKIWNNSFKKNIVRQNLK